MLMTNLSILTRFSRTFCERKLNDRNIGFTEQSVLQFLSDQDNVNQEAIVKHFMLDKGSIAKTLSKLEEKALINRVDNPNNKREKLITITELGRENSYTYQDEIHEFHNFLLEGLTMEEINEFTRIIEIMTQNAIKAVQGRMDEYDSAE
jgi:DNA-binding MarR family transcriptional regulator